MRKTQPSDKRAPEKIVAEAPAEMALLPSGAFNLAVRPAPPKGLAGKVIHARRRLPQIPEASTPATAAKTRGG